jgi:hypothetical protein
MYNFLENKSNLNVYKSFYSKSEKWGSADGIDYQPRLKPILTPVKAPPGLDNPELHDPKRHSSQKNWEESPPNGHQMGLFKSTSAYYDYQRPSGYNTPPPIQFQGNVYQPNYGPPNYNEGNMQYYQGIQYENMNNQFASMGPIQYAAIPMAYMPGYASYSQPCYYASPQPPQNLPGMKKTTSATKKKSPTKSSQFKPYNQSLNPLESEKFASDLIKEFEENSTDYNILAGSIRKIAQTQAGSRFLQKQLSKGTPEFIEFVLKEIENSLPELMTNDYGNYFCQRLLFNCSPSHRLLFIKQIRGQIVSISKDSRGIHTIQSIFDVMTMEEEEKILADDLKTHVCELAMVMFSDIYS